MIHRKIVNLKGAFHKAPSSRLYLMGTFSGPNPLSLKFLISILLNCDGFDYREWSKIKPRRYSFFLPFFSLCAFLFSFDPVSLHGLGFYVFLRSVL